MCGGGFETAGGCWLLMSGGVARRAEGGGTSCNWKRGGRNVERGAKAGVGEAV